MQLIICGRMLQVPRFLLALERVQRAGKLPTGLFCWHLSMQGSRQLLASHQTGAVMSWYCGAQSHCAPSRSMILALRRPSPWPPEFGVPHVGTESGGFTQGSCKDSTSTRDLSTLFMPAHPACGTWSLLLLCCTLAAIAVTRANGTASAHRRLNLLHANEACIQNQQLLL